MRPYWFALALAFVTLTHPSFVHAEEGDLDMDGLSDKEELLYKTDISNPDTDGDGYTDGVEVAEGYSPLLKEKILLTAADSDKDGLSDALEVVLGTNLSVKDTDGDGYEDYLEVMEGYNPLDASKEARMERKLLVNRSTQMMQYVAGNTIIHEFPVSTGNPSTPTPDGTFFIGKKLASKRYTGVGYDLKNVKWNMEFKTGGYFIHAAYWHDDFGKKTHSHGCINMREPDAKILYTYLDAGVPVVVSGTTPKKRTVGT